MNEPIYTIIKCYDAAVMPEYRNQTQYSGFAYVCWYIRSGSVIVKASGKKLQAQAGDWVFVEPLTTKEQSFRINAHIISIRFGVNWNNLHFFPPLRPPWMVSGETCPPLLEAAAELCAYESILETTGSTLSPLAYARRSALFSNWLYHWHQLRGTPDENTALSMDTRVSSILTELMRTPGITPIDYKNLSRVVGLSAPQINRIFKQSTGQTLKSWKDTECLKIAEVMLGRDECSIKETADKLGFTDTSHFTKWFYRHMNQTPSQWRKYR